MKTWLIKNSLYIWAINRSSDTWYLKKRWAVKIQRKGDLQSFEKELDNEDMKERWYGSKYFRRWQSINALVTYLCLQAVFPICIGACYRLARKVSLVFHGIELCVPSWRLHAEHDWQVQHIDLWGSTSALQKWSQNFSFASISVYLDVRLYHSNGL